MCSLAPRDGMAELWGVGVLGPGWHGVERRQDQTGRGLHGESAGGQCAACGGRVPGGLLDESSGVLRRVQGWREEPWPAGLPPW